MSVGDRVGRRRDGPPREVPSNPASGGAIAAGLAVCAAAGAGYLILAALRRVDPAPGILNLVVMVAFTAIALWFSVRLGTCARTLWLVQRGSLGSRALAACPARTGGALRISTPQAVAALLRSSPRVLAATESGVVAVRARLARRPEPLEEWKYGVIEEVELVGLDGVNLRTASGEASFGGVPPSQSKAFAEVVTGFLRR